MTNHPGKGKKDGRCNVTACQAPLQGTRQGYMRDHMIEGGRLYYCAVCCARFNEWDDRIRTERRITWDETTFHRERATDAGPVEQEPDHLSGIAVSPITAKLRPRRPLVDVTDYQGMLQRAAGKPAHGLYGAKKKRLFRP